ncbi:hypothetical protein GIB67_021954 [Kingdonia uniflora]|uniref:HECT-type E3 ubiquitin transferase n=1 Tax=Kingdonia uniflora TaxID=39325 RepID=A0A7J7P8H9_9MAGN|nr:hypothetical protein GIB67_021954 [Kingdonia uniflora]
MFFSGDSTSRKRVDLGGRSSKERDRQKLLEQTRLERERRLGLRKENSAALKIQKCFRGRTVVEAERSKTREQFYHTFGERCEKVDRACFNHNSEFLRQLLFFFNAQNSSDFLVLVETCQLLHQFVRVSGDVVNLFGGTNTLLSHAVVENRVKKLAYACLLVVHQNRNRLKDQLLMSSDFSNMPIVVLLEGVIILTDPELPWSCKTVGYLSQRHIMALLRDIVHTGMQNLKIRNAGARKSSLEHILTLMISHVGRNQCICLSVNQQWSFSSQFLTIPFLWSHFPYLKEVFLSQGLIDFYIHQMAMCVHSHANFLPDDVSREFPGCACLLGNILEVVGASLSRPTCSFDLAVDFVAVSTFMLDMMPPINSPSRENATTVEEEMDVDEMDLDVEKKVVVNMSNDLERQICKSVDPRLLQQLVTVLFRGSSLIKDSNSGSFQYREVTAVGAICVFLHVIFNTLPVEGIMIGVAYRTELVPMLCNFMKQCHEKQQWPSLSKLTSHLSDGAPGWLLPLAVFCPVYKHMLVIVDNEEFYEQEKPLSLRDIKDLIIILKQALWQLLWVFPAKPSNSMKSATAISGLKRLSIDFLQHRVSIVTSELLTQLQDWNNRREFTSPSDFQAQEAVDDVFISQAATENTTAYDILRQAPFLLPFTSRVKIFTSYLTSARQRNWAHVPFNRNRFRIRRDRIFEDAFNQLSALSEEELRGLIRVTFVNEFGVEEAGIDGGGIFKDFMESITRAAFDVQYGLFKVGLCII